jgi:GT2 family glycosyltransferase
MNSASNKTVSIIIVTGGANNYLEDCLFSLKAQTREANQIIVIDNSLNLDLNRRIRQRYPGVQVVTSAENLFYARALNIGIALSSGDIVLCMNDDVILKMDFIDQASRGFMVDPRIGMVSGKILRQDKKTIDSTGLFVSLWRTAKERGYGCVDFGQFESEGYVFGASGAVALYRRTMLEDVKERDGYFDPDFYLFYEDLDIAWRAQRFGWKGYYMPSAVAYHVRGGSSRIPQGINKSWARRFIADETHAHLIKNRYLTIIKNETGLSFLLHLPFVALYDLFMWSYVFICSPRQITLFLTNLKFFKWAWKKRKEIKRRAKK